MITVGNGRAPAEEAAEETAEEAEQFAERVYLALMAVARGSSAKLRDQLGACVLLGRPWSSAGDAVRAVVRRFIDEAEL